MDKSKSSSDDREVELNLAKMMDRMMNEQKNLYTSINGKIQDLRQEFIRRDEAMFADINEGRFMVPFASQSPIQPGQQCGISSISPPPQFMSTPAGRPERFSSRGHRYAPNRKSGGQRQRFFYNRRHSDSASFENHRIRRDRDE